MSNPHYTAAAVPASRTKARSVTMRDEFSAIETGFTSVETALGLKAPAANPTITGTATFTGTIDADAAATLVAQGQAQNEAAVRQRLFASDPAPTFTASKVATQTTANKIARLFPDLKATATYAGAIHAVQVVATFTV